MSDTINTSILIVEDEDRWQDIYEEALGDEYLLTSARTLQEAESALGKTKFDLAIIDPCLDRKDPFNSDGIKIIKRINTLDPSIQVIVVTGDKDRIREGDQQINGFIDTVIEKGASVDDLTQAVRKAIKVKTAKRRWNYLGRPTARVTGYDAFKKILSQLLHLAKADVVHLLVPNEQGELEIIVDTGQDEGRTVKINNSVTGRSYRSKESIKLDDCQVDPEYQAPQNVLTMNSELAIPVWQGDEIMGVLNIESQRMGAFDVWHQDLMETFTDLAVLMLQEGRRQTDLRQLNTIADALLKPTSDLNRALKQILELGLKLVDAQMGFLGRDKNGDLFVEVSTANNQNEKMWPIKKTLIADAIRSGLPKRAVHEDIVEAAQLDSGNLSEMIVPFVTDGIIWVLGFGRKKPQMFTAEHEKLASLLANQISFAISRENQSRRLIELEGQQKQSALAAQLVHSVGNPIRNMRNWLQDIHSDKDGLEHKFPNVFYALSEIEQNIDQLMKVVAQVKQSLGQSSQKTTPMDVNECVRSAVNEIQNSEMAKNIRIDVQLGKDLPKALADTRLKTVILELMQNSLDAMSIKGEIKIITASNVTGVSITVVDTGPGISPKAQPYIFDVGFTTKDQPTKADGLGLYSCKMYIESCGGSIIEKGKPGQGAIFYITLPIVREYNEV